MKALNFSMSLIALALVFYILIIGKALLLPLVLAIVFWYFISAMAREYARIKFKKYKMPYPVALALSMITFIIVISLFVGLINDNINDVVRVVPEYQERFTKIIAGVYEFFDLPDTLSIKQLFANLDLVGLFTGGAQIVTTIAGNIGLILIYVLFLLIEQHSMDEKIKALFPEKKRYKEVTGILERISADINIYIRIKTVMSVLTGLLSYVVMMIIGVDFASFWALLIFVLNYIPTIGSIIAVFFPMVVVLIQFASWPLFAITAVLLVGIQFAIGNVLEPRLMGHSLNLSSLVILLSLALWGSIWGIVGMLLCVPITVIINIVLANFSKTRWIAILLSADGRV